MRHSKKKAFFLNTATKQTPSLQSVFATRRRRRRNTQLFFIYPKKPAFQNNQKLIKHKVRTFISL